MHGDLSYRQLMRTLDDLAPATADELASATGRPAGEVATSLDALSADGYVRQGRDGRWTGVPQYLREPRPEEFDEPHRSLVGDFLDEKYDRELRLLTWAKSHREDFGSWGKGHRATARLTETELRELDAEYRELLTRYCLLRRHPAPGAREVAVRFYAFPSPESDTATGGTRALS